MLYEYLMFSKQYFADLIAVTKSAFEVNFMETRKLPFKINPWGS